MKPNCRNVVRNEADKLRSFGCPTIRKDIPYKEFKSVADYQVSSKIKFLLKLFSFFRTTVTSQRQLIFCSHQIIPKSAFKSKISELSKAVMKSDHFLKRLDSVTKLVNSMQCIIELKSSLKAPTIEFLSDTSRWQYLKCIQSNELF